MLIKTNRKGPMLIKKRIDFSLYLCNDIILLGGTRLRAEDRSTATTELYNNLGLQNM